VFPFKNKFSIYAFLKKLKKLKVSRMRIKFTAYKKDGTSVEHNFDINVKEVK
jgi:NOL1/NOP2/fmu family ribosome biogenesis protein